MKGIILAGGSGTRLRPLTNFVCKQLLPIYDKPLIYYPLSTLMLLGIQDILIISTPKDTPILQEVLKDGADLGIKLQYAVQPEPGGLAQAFLIGESFVGQDPCCLILGDNILHWSDIGGLKDEVTAMKDGAMIIGYRVKDPWRFGVIEFDKDGKVLSIEEKPKTPKSNYAAIGLYFYDGSVVQRAKALKPSPRGELEITDLNNAYLRDGTLRAKMLSRGATWLDAGTFESMMRAANFMEIVEERQGLKIGCPEEVAYVMGYINADQLAQLAEQSGKSPYGEYLMRLARES